MQPLLQYPTLLTRVLRSRNLILLLLLLPLSSLQAKSLFVGEQPIPPAVALVEKQTEILLEQLSSRKQEFTEQPAELVRFAQTVALSHWDLTKASRLILGPHWRSASAIEREAFEEQFLRTLLRYVVRAYGYYDDNLIQVLEYDWQPVRTGGWVLSKLQIPGGLKVNVDYRMSKNRTDDSWNLIDVRFEGISLVMVKRSEFRELIAKNGLQSLIQSMTDKNNAVLDDIIEVADVSASEH